MPMPPSGLLRWAASPSQKRPAEAEALGNALMHPIERHVDDVVMRNRALRRRARAGERRLVAASSEAWGRAGTSAATGPGSAGRNATASGPPHNTPSRGRERCVEDEGRRHQETFRPGKSREFDAEPLADLAARAIGADQPAAGAVCKVARWRCRSDAERVGILTPAATRPPNAMRNAGPPPARHEDAGEVVDCSALQPVMGGASRPPCRRKSKAAIDPVVCCGIGIAGRATPGRSAGRRRRVRPAYRGSGDERGGARVSD